MASPNATNGSLLKDPSSTPSSYGAIGYDEQYGDERSSGSWGHFVDHSRSFGGSTQSRWVRRSTDAFRASMRSMHSGVRTSIRIAVDASFVLHGSSCSVRDLGGDATIPNEIFNMAKNLVGSGVFSLSSGMAYFYAHSSYSVVATCLSSTFWIVLLGTIFGYFCLLIAKVCNITMSATYRECWEESIGSNGALLVATVNALKPALGNLAYSTILSQTGASLLQTIGWAQAGGGRIESLLIITIVALLPLCLLKNLTVLAPFSVLGTTGILFTAVAMIVRCWDGSYEPGGRFYDDIPNYLQPDFTKPYAIAEPRPMSVSLSIIQMLPFVLMVFEAYVMHYNSPRFFTELRRPTIPRFGAAVTGSFGLAAVIYAVIATVGFLTFGSNSDGYILNNYSPDDPLATACRLVVALSTLLTFPIVFIGFRDGVVDVLDIPPEKQTSGNLNALTVVLLGIITATAVFCTDLGIINAVGGGSLGTLIVFVFPAAMYRNAITETLGERATERERNEAVVAIVLMVLGIIVGVDGLVESVKA